MGEVIWMDKYMIPRPTIDDEIAKCDADFRKHGRCHLVDDKRHEPFDVYTKERE